MPNDRELHPNYDKKILARELKLLTSDPEAEFSAPFGDKTGLEFNSRPDEKALLQNSPNDRRTERQITNVLAHAPSFSFIHIIFYSFT